MAELKNNDIHSFKREKDQKIKDLTDECLNNIIKNASQYVRFYKKSNQIIDELKSTSHVFETFQNDLKRISEQLRTLQSKSSKFKIQLDNRSKLYPTIHRLLSSVVITEDMIITLEHRPIGSPIGGANEQLYFTNYVACLKRLENIFDSLEGPWKELEVKAFNEILPEATRLREISSSRIVKLYIGLFKKEVQVEYPKSPTKQMLNVLLPYFPLMNSLRQHISLYHDITGYFVEISGIAINSYMREVGKLLKLKHQPRKNIGLNGYELKRGFKFFAKSERYDNEFVLESRGFPSYDSWKDIEDINEGEFLSQSKHYVTSQMFDSPLIVYLYLRDLYIIFNELYSFVNIYFNNDCDTYFDQIIDRVFDDVRIFLKTILGNTQNVVSFLIISVITGDFFEHALRTFNLNETWSNLLQDNFSYLNHHLSLIMDTFEVEKNIIVSNPQQLKDYISPSFLNLAQFISSMQVIINSKNYQSINCIPLLQQHMFEFIKKFKLLLLEIKVNGLLLPPESSNSLYLTNCLHFFMQNIKLLQKDSIVEVFLLTLYKENLHKFLHIFYPEIIGKIRLTNNFNRDNKLLEKLLLEIFENFENICISFLNDMKLYCYNEDLYLELYQIFLEDFKETYLGFLNHLQALESLNTTNKEYFGPLHKYFLSGKSFKAIFAKHDSVN
eukprot:TRINITY_DN9509_c0_g1_i1.p1 TRINITY_DN9509_c0_g1~~TRINITY_DN9509_c0_g1_i1.p1  ORF type:complete len:711 (+),score=125.02 TRINITY_DN9509_c0_g1_i1:127-2133(+)